MIIDGAGSSFRTASPAVAGWTGRDAGVFLVALLWLAATIGLRPYTLPDEGRYVGVAWEMLVSGDWLCPMLNGLPFFHKPPLFYWLTAGSFSLFGVHTWAARLTPLLGAAVAAFTLYGFALRQSSRTVARLALLVLVTNVFFFFSAQFASLDMLVAGFISATTILAGEAAIDAAADRPYRGRLAAAYLCAALGVLAKGLIGAALPGLAIVLWLLWTRRPGLMLKLLWLPGIALFALIAVPWFVAMQMRFPGFFHYFFIYQQFERYTHGGFNNPQPFWFYVPVLFVGMLPWAALLRAARRRTDTERSGTPSVTALMWIAAGSVVVFFSIPTSKMLGYVLPAVPPLAYLIGDSVSRRLEARPGFARKLRWLAGVAAVLCVAAPLGQLAVDHNTNRAVARHIAAARQEEEPIYFLKDQFFDVPLYLKLREPVPVLDDWQRRSQDPNPPDNWRKALVDAAQFDPERAKSILLERDTLVPLLCARPVSFVIAKKKTAAQNDVLANLSPLFRDGDRAVWRVTSRELQIKGFCPKSTGTT